MEKIVRENFEIRTDETMAIPLPCQIESNQKKEKFDPDMGLALAGQFCYNRPVGVSIVSDHEEQEDRESSDALYISRVLNGDRNAFAFILKKYKMYVMKIVSRHIPFEDAEEVAHDAFIRIYESLAKLNGPDGLKQWMAAIATRTCYDYWRKAYKSKEVPMSSFGEEHQEWLERILSGVPESSIEDRMVLELVYMEELSIREVADLLGWSTANVKIRSFRSRAKMRKLLEGLIR